MKESYKEMKSRHQKEFNALPLGFAYSDDQFNEMMVQWGLDPDKDTDKIYRESPGCYIQKKDAFKLYEFLERAEKEEKDAIKNDDTGEFLFSMFQTVFNDYGTYYTGNFSDALAALDLTFQDVKNDGKLYRAFRAAWFAGDNE